MKAVVVGNTPRETELFVLYLAAFWTFSVIKRLERETSSDRLKTPRTLTSNCTKMSEVVGPTELQIMEADVKLLQAKFKKVKEAENMSTACSRIVASVNDKAPNDAFLVREASPPNKFHSSGAGGEGGCCVVS